MAEATTDERLILYQTEWCPYCVYVRRVIDQLGADVELRNIRDDPRHREALIAARGRQTVPVLRRIRPDGSESWLPESRDIVRFLQERFG